MIAVLEKQLQATSVGVAPTSKLHAAIDGVDLAADPAGTEVTQRANYLAG